MSPIPEEKDQQRRPQSLTREALFEIRDSPIHGRGGFARCDISAGTRVVEYLGERITKAESLRRCEANNPYIFHLDNEFDLDGEVPWNPARFLNHSCEPNCEAVQDQGRIWIVARRDIRAGEELTFNYGYDLVDYQDYPCHCGAPYCVGYLVAEEFHPLLRARQAQAQTAATSLTSSPGP